MLYAESRVLQLIDLRILLMLNVFSEKKDLSSLYWNFLKFISNAMMCHILDVIY